MIYTKFGDTNLSVSVLGFGTMRLPIRPVNADFSPAIRLIRHAIERGINYFDIGTFYCHHQAETAFGLATKDIERDRLLISGKNSTHQYGADSWLQQLQHSLALFERDYFDIYFIHYLNLEQWQNHFIKKSILHQVQEALESGLVRHLGFSSHDTPENVRRIIDSGWFAAVILQFNLLQRKYESVMRYAFESGLGVMTMNPLAGGALVDANLYLTENAQNHDDHKTAESALKFVLSQPFIHSVLSGMQSIEIIDANVHTVHQKNFSQKEIQHLNQRISEEKVKLLIPCNGCNYCMPCPQGIDIPAVLKIWNQYNILQGNKMYSREYEALPVPAECCIHCESCQDKCPQQIAIPDRMDEASELFSQL
ncbi:MAG: aldo/keto reductase [bacterium]